MGMKRLILMLLLCAGGFQMRSEEKDSLLVVFWNLENFFDWTDQKTSESDKDFSSYGVRHWTRSRFYAKCDAVAKAVMWIADKNGRMPDVIGLAEIENRGVLNKMLSSTLLRKYDYEIIHKESQDRRGIDVALLYRKSSMHPLSYTFITPENMTTRDILHVRMSLSQGNMMDFIVNHHPSKYGGVRESERKRMTAMDALIGLCDSLSSGGSNRILAMGDFNDSPVAEQFSHVSVLLDNKGLELHKRGQGSIRYKGHWELIDFFLAGSDIVASPMKILEIPFLMTYDRSYPGYKPLRTYSGPRYIGGVSDHCPIMIYVK